MYNIYTTHPVKRDAQISSIYECKHVGFTTCWHGNLRATSLIKISTPHTLPKFP